MPREGGEEGNVSRDPRRRSRRLSHRGICIPKALLLLLLSLSPDAKKRREVGWKWKNEVQSANVRFRR